MMAIAMRAGADNAAGWWWWWQQINGAMIKMAKIMTMTKMTGWHYQLDITWQYNQPHERAMAADKKWQQRWTRGSQGKQEETKTSVQTRGFAWETIQPDCEMDIPVTYSDKNGTEKFDDVLGDVQTNKKFHYNYKPRGALPLGQFLLVGPLFLCVEKVRGRK
jgi:hypothetical protein